MRLNVIAALRARTIHHMIKNNLPHPQNPPTPPLPAKKAARTANGMAKTV